VANTHVLLLQEKELRAGDARVTEARTQLAAAKEDHEKLSSHFFALQAKLEALNVRAGCRRALVKACSVCWTLPYACAVCRQSCRRDAPC
jgi:hypothetical protein